MLGKLLKHELRATARIILPVYLLLAGSTLLFNLFMRLADRYDNLTALQFFRATTVMIYIVTLIGAGVVTWGLMIFRFYKNYMSDEGYLMFTLPATTDQLILSKLIVAVAWSVLTAAAICLSVFLATLGLVDWATAWPQFKLFFSEIASVFSSGYFVSIGISLFLSVIGGYLLFYAAIALGHSFANHKILLSVAFYFAFSMGMRSVSSLFSVFLIVFSDGILSENATEAAASSFMTASSLLSAGLSLIFAVVFYFVTRLLLKKRLNLQ